MAETPNGYSRSQGDRVAAETLIRTSVMALANGAPVGDIDELIRRNASQVSHADVMAGRLNTNVLGDIINTVEKAKSTAPFNWNAATPQQISAYLASKGIAFTGTEGARISGAKEGAGGALSSRGGNQFSELKGASGLGDTSTAPGSGYSMLTAANQNISGFTQAQVAGAANFLKQHGESREDINHDTRHMVHLRDYRKPIGDLATRQHEIDRRRARGEDVGSDQAALDAKKKTVRESMPEGKRKHFDELKLIRAHDKKAAELEGKQKVAFEGTQQDMVGLNERLGVEKKVEEGHREDIEKVQSAAAATEDAAARLARHTQKAKVAEANNESVTKTAEQGAAKQETTASASASQQAKAAEKRQAINTKSFNPTV